MWVDHKKRTIHRLLEDNSVTKFIILNLQCIDSFLVSLVVSQDDILALDHQRSTYFIIVIWRHRAQICFSLNTTSKNTSSEGHYDADMLHHLVQWRIAHWSLKPTMSQCDSSFSGGKCSLFFPSSFVEMWTHGCSSAGSYVLGATTCPQSIKESCLQASAG